jgi:phage terminase large subunit-like protein
MARRAQSIGQDHYDLIAILEQSSARGNNLQPATRDLTDVDPPHADDKALVPCSVGNARIEPRANSILVTKQASGIGKIDPLMALFDAVDLMLLDPSNTRRSVYETRELLVV